MKMIINDYINFFTIVFLLIFIDLFISLYSQKYLDFQNQEKNLFSYFSRRKPDNPNNKEIKRRYKQPRRKRAVSIHQYT